MSKKIERPTFKVGDWVLWRIGSNNMVGRVVEVIPGKEGKTRWSDWGERTRMREQFEKCADKHGAQKASAGGGSSRNHESYFVLAPRGGRLKPRLYWPVVSGLRAWEHPEDIPSDFGEVS